MSAMRPLRLVGPLLAMLLLAGCTTPAQDPDQPYAGLETSPIRGLTPQQVAELENGTGMGLALPAELNGYPGPRHVLDHAGQLDLTDAQRAQVQAIWDAMHGDAVARGQDVLAAYRQLDQLFREGEPTPEAVQAASDQVGQAEARLRAVHLVSHLETLRVLTHGQVEAYNALRGYGGETGGHGNGHDDGHGH